LSTELSCVLDQQRHEARTNGAHLKLGFPSMEKSKINEDA
jgi:hypothetical protein